MRLFIQFCSSIALLACASTALACCNGYDYTKEDMSGYNLQPNFHVNGDSDYSRNGTSFYFYTGYLYTHRFLNNKQQTANAKTGGSTISYSAKNTIPDSYHGFEIGFGKELTRHIDMQMGYLQNLRQTRNATIGGAASKISGKMNGVQALVGYVINPDDQFQVMPIAGALIYEFNESITVGSVDYSPANSPVRINPQAGLELIFQFNKRVAFRLSGLYAFNTYNSASSGELNVLGGLSCTL
ncbi:MAG: hypothetical protein COY58_06325 [Gammaproteobacteria bacterium CG_4_10_14_0_8_um_filter_38_16]|nr:MAG: hypothetical protein COY58_06325 [Gammaproteobacteria bacterium CG_4_10_14_0_8_um_filter_38_16]PJA02605.1 MAG: hypothetical protein COX72_09165 [Gammaproteobacteria bacterium CG_4_10_14_0_2_um_filter_38_22]PJB10562.1 MAG: hypothetical protein CO120_04220 [Gammaproteobacteria bacterium CG_4_9_14_3_um_filter_38_9]